MARAQTLSYTSASVSANSSLTENKLGFASSIFNIVRIKVTPNTAGGSTRVQIFGKATFLTTDLMYSAGPFTGALIDPIERNTQLERKQFFVCNYEDLDGTGGLHIKIFNDDSVAKTYAVEIDYESPSFISNTKTLTDNTNTDLFEIQIPSSDLMGGALLMYTITTDDNTNSQVETGIRQIAWYVTAGGTKLATTSQCGTALQHLSAGTLTMTWGVSNTAGGVSIQLQANTSLNVPLQITFSLLNTAVETINLI